MASLPMTAGLVGPRSEMLCVEIQRASYHADSARLTRTRTLVAIEAMARGPHSQPARQNDLAQPVAWSIPDLSCALDRIYKQTYLCIVDAPIKPVRWVGSSRDDLKTFPRTVQRHIGQALYAAQRGIEYPTVKALKGFGGRSVLEIVALDERGSYRAVYTIRLRDAIYVLHVFQKKSTKGIATPRREIELIKQRLVAAEQDHRRRQS